jgi:magnesium-transporting ATPase (P-type)
LTEELGQIEYVFSDKTGTLTANVMSFKKFSVGKTAYGTDDIMTADEKKKQEPNVSFIDKKFDEDYQKLISGTRPQLMEEGNEIELFLVFLSLCHNIIIDAKTGKYNAASPDELALVNFAKQYNYEFIGRDGDDVCTVR